MLVGALLASACGQSAPADPEADHCARAAQRLARDIGVISVIESSASTSGDVRNVRVRFAYPQNEQGLDNGTIKCSYAFPVTVRGDKNRLPQAQSVYFRARNLSENELLLLNMNLRGTRPDYKIK